MSREAIRRILRSLASDDQGTMLIETAIVAPVLIIFALGSYDVGRLVTRQLELQSGVAEAESIALAANAGASTNTVELASELKKSLSLPDGGVEVKMLYRCSANSTLVENIDACNENDVVSNYVQIRLQDKYDPLWTSFGVSKTFDYDVIRTVQLGIVASPDPVEPV